GDLIAATQGRGFWVLDDLTPLREMNADVRGEKAHLFPPRPAIRYAYLSSGNDGDDGPPPAGAGQSPPTGVVFHYFLDKAPAADKADPEVKLEILSGDGKDGKVLRTFTNKREEKKPEAEPGEGLEAEEGRPVPEPETPESERLPAEAGLNRFVWDMTEEAGTRVPGLILWSGTPIAPRAVPGTYTARLTAGGVTRTVPFEIRKDPLSAATLDDLRAQHQFLVETQAKLNQTQDAIRRIREARTQIADLRKRLPEGKDGDAVRDAAKALGQKLTAVEQALYQTKNRSPQDPLNFPIRLNDKLNGVAQSAAMGDRRPTRQHIEVRDALVAAIDAELAKLEAVWTTDLAAFNDLARQKGVAAVIPPPSQLK
ncbi:MAG TPA: glycosyl hydrolase, partial [Thermoanaerobaculia bacterium]|nr:glycosyl hydrolase [Thermoanaerobaculia bacterium]